MTRVTIQMKKYFILLMLFLAGFVTACTKEKDMLTDNKWKLVGFVDAQTVDMREPERWDEETYILTFKKYQKWEAISSMNRIEGKYSINYSKNKINISMSMGTTACELPDGNIYADALVEVDFFSVEENELKLYYNDKQNFLLFKSQKR